jgi:hypothetical protein
MLHITARIRLLKTEEGGRTAFVRSGYHPNVRFGELYTGYGPLKMPGVSVRYGTDLAMNSTVRITLHT